MSEILPSSGWALGQVTWAKKVKNLLHLWHHSQKKRNTKPKNFFALQIRRLAESYEGLNSSLVQLVELCHLKDTCKLL